MKGLIILANGFEDTEAITTIDVLKRSGIEVITATPNDDLKVLTQYHHEMKANVILSDVSSNDFDFLVIPGGGAVYTVLHNIEYLPQLISEFINDNKVVAAICAAPSLLGKNGFLKGLDYTCFPGWSEDHYGNLMQDKGVVVTNNLITAKAMYYTIDFALEIIKKLQGEQQMNKILNSIKGEK